MENSAFGYESERMQILRMVEQGQINAMEAAELLSALNSGKASQESLGDLTASQAEESLEMGEPVETPTQSPTKPTGSARWFRVKVTDLNTGRAKVTVNLPIGLVNWGMKIGARYSPEVPNLDFDELSQIIQSGAEGKLVDVIDEEDGEHVEIFVD